MFRIVLGGVEDLPSATAVISQLREDYNLNIEHPFVDDNGVDVITFIGKRGIRKIIDSNYEKLCENLGVSVVDSIVENPIDDDVQEVFNFLFNGA